jgi:CO/xanthine dehydrogenase Mo-binding subunit
MTEQSTPYVGRSLRRREDLKFLAGRGRYVDDIALPGMLYLAILRSPHAHARITRIDLSAARAAAGVRLALAGADLCGKIGDIKPNWVIPGTVVNRSRHSKVGISGPRRRRRGERAYSPPDQAPVCTGVFSEAATVRRWH